MENQQFKQNEVLELLQQPNAFYLYEKFKNCLCYGTNIYNNVRHMRETFEIISGFYDDHAFVESSRQSYMTTALAFQVVQDLMMNQNKTIYVFSNITPASLEIKNRVWYILEHIYQYMGDNVKDHFTMSKMNIINNENKTRILFSGLSNPSLLRGLSVNKVYFDCINHCNMSIEQQKEFIMGMAPVFSATKTKIVSVQTGLSPKPSYISLYLFAISTQHLHFDYFDMPYFSYTEMKNRIKQFGSEIFNREYLLM